MLIGSNILLVAIDKHISVTNPLTHPSYKDWDDAPLDISSKAFAIPDHRNHILDHMRGKPSAQLHAVFDEIMMLIVILWNVFRGRQRCGGHGAREQSTARGREPDSKGKNIMIHRYDSRTTIETMFMNMDR